MAKIQRFRRNELIHIQGRDMTAAVGAAIAYGVLAIVGGIIGYKQAQSKMSLISGSISGLLLLIGAGLQLAGIAAGWWLALIVAIALVGVFIGRLVKTRKFMPAGLMVIAGVATVVVMLV